MQVINQITSRIRPPQLKDKFNSALPYGLFGTFLTNVAIFESHFLEKKLFGYKLSFGLFLNVLIMGSY